jgi:serine protease Do
LVASITIVGNQIHISSPLPSNQSSVEVQSPDTHDTEQVTTIPTDLSIEEIGKLSNRVVYIEVYDERGQALGSGSGIVVGSEGEILTNYHVIEGATSARVDFTDQKSYKTSTLLIKDEDRDLALLKIDASSLPALSLGDSSALNLGEAVVAIGSPLGFKNTLSSGVVSTPSRMVDGHDYIQISTPIDHGSSGGALFNRHGELVGVTTALVESSAAINLAIPSNDVKTFLAKPKSSQALSIPIPKPTSLSPQELQSYLSANYSGIPYQDITLHFKWIVSKSGDGQKYLIVGTMYNTLEWSNWITYQLSDSTAVPRMIYYLSEELREKLGIDNTFLTLYLDSYFSFYPSSFPSSSISIEDPGYRISYNFIYGIMDYSSGYLFYNLTPENKNAIQKIKMK